MKPSVLTLAAPNLPAFASHLANRLCSKSLIPFLIEVEVVICPRYYFLTYTTTTNGSAKVIQQHFKKEELFAHPTLRAARELSAVQEIEALLELPLRKEGYSLQEKDYRPYLKNPDALACLGWKVLPLEVN